MWHPPTAASAPRPNLVRPQGLPSSLLSTGGHTGAGLPLDDGGWARAAADVLQLQGMALGPGGMRGAGWDAVGPGWDAMGPGWDAVGPAAELALLPEPWDLREAPPTLSLGFLHLKRGLVILYVARERHEAQGENDR